MFSKSILAALFASVAVLSQDLADSGTIGPLIDPIIPTDRPIIDPIRPTDRPIIDPIRPTDNGGYGGNGGNRGNGGYGGNGGNRGNGGYGGNGGNRGNGGYGDNGNDSGASYNDNGNNNNYNDGNNNSYNDGNNIPIYTDVVTITQYPPPTYTRTIVVDPINTVTKYIDVTVFDCSSKSRTRRPVIPTIVPVYAGGGGRPRQSYA
ncbi:hypothetical protein AYI68_g3077 [Smittium mucronatum]|uniref:Uncharacterized protein n=1 Tax=Smittium mucronatum TaxID=133383 RepID=A0A1R0H0W5_9FUNG|nr:hypothetical protein AYI68_g3077 [Smittium mucronatum]